MQASDKEALQKEQQRLTKLIGRLSEKQRLAKIGEGRDKIVKEILNLRQNLRIVEEKLKPFEEEEETASNVTPFPKKN